MDPNDPIDRGVLLTVAALATDIANFKKAQLETLEAVILHVPAIRDSKIIALLSELEQGLAVAQTLSERVENLKKSLGL